MAELDDLHAALVRDPTDVLAWARYAAWSRANGRPEWADLADRFVAADDGRRGAMLADLSATWPAADLVGAEVMRRVMAARAHELAARFVAECVAEAEAMVGVRRGGPPGLTQGRRGIA